MSQPEPPRLHRLDHFVLTVLDIDTTVRFYRDGLGMRHDVFTTPDGEKRHALFFGTAKINLHQQGAEFEPKAKRPACGSADLCFLTQTPLGAWVSHLNALGVTIEQGPVPRTGATGPLMSLYVRDPDGNLVEISVSDQTA